MDKKKDIIFLTQNIEKLDGVGNKIRKLLKKKKVEKVSDLLWNLPHDFTDRTNLREIENLEIGKITTIKVIVKKYNFPRIRNLPNKVICEDSKGKIDIVFFNSKEGYIRKILPLNSAVFISGKIGFYKGKYQITNPAYAVPISREEFVNKIIPKYSLTEGITEKVYRKIIEQVLDKLPNLEEWHSLRAQKKFQNIKWKEAVLKLHNIKKKIKINSLYYKRLAYDEMLSNFIILSKLRRKIKKTYKKNKIFKNKLSKTVINNFKFKLTKGQTKIINEINYDLQSKERMFRILQGDVGTGKTIISLVAAANVIESNYQSALMAPTEILSRQHYELAKKIFSKTNVNIQFLGGKTKLNDKNSIIKKLSNGEINLLIGTHAIFQEKILFKNLGLVIIDEQHKFGVKQRIELSKKGGNNCDILLMSATPIPRTLVMTFYGDMDVSKLIEKPLERKNVLTFSKPEEKIDEVLDFIKKQISISNQIFWVCPLIEESKKLEYVAAVKRYDFLTKLFPNKVGLIHGNLSKEDKEKVLKLFLNKTLSILVSTTVIEVGIDFPNANVIIIENSNKFGLSQLHQLRGRVGRGLSQGTCILLYKKNLSENAKRRIAILKSTNDGFEIAEKDMKLRGFGDILGHQQSGIKEFKLADPIIHEDLFSFAEIDIKEIENSDNNFNRYETLLKIYDSANLINEINS